MRIEHCTDATMRFLRRFLFHLRVFQRGSIEAGTAVVAINPFRLVFSPAFLANQLRHSAGLLGFDSAGFDPAVEPPELSLAAGLSPPLAGGASFFAASWYDLLR